MTQHCNFASIFLKTYQCVIQNKLPYATILFYGIVHIIIGYIPSRSKLYGYNRIRQHNSYLCVFMIRGHKTKLLTFELLLNSFALRSKTLPWIVALVLGIYLSEPTHEIKIILLFLNAFFCWIRQSLRCLLSKVSRTIELTQHFIPTVISLHIYDHSIDFWARAHYQTLTQFLKLEALNTIQRNEKEIHINFDNNLIRILRNSYSVLITN